MKACNSFDNIDGQSFITVKSGVIIKVSRSFTDMTEYLEEDLLDKSIKELFSILRVGPNIDIKAINEDTDYFLFTKSWDARFVNIIVVEGIFEKTFVFSEKPLSRLDTKFPSIEALCSHSTLGIAVFSTPDITLLKANQTYLNFFDKPFTTSENSIGKRLQEIIPGWIGSSSEDIWKNVLATQKPFYSDEYMFQFERGITYWEASLAPVFENGILKYCIEISTDITEKVLNRKKIEEQAKVIAQQKRELEIILDNMVDGFSTIDKEGRYVNINKTIRKWMDNEDTKKVGDSLNTHKYFDMEGNELSKEDLPPSRIARGEKIEQYEFLMKTDRYEKYFSMSGIPIYDENGVFVKGIENTRDITETVLYRKKLKEQMEEIKLKNKQLKEQKELLELIINNMTDSLIVFDNDGNYILKNKASAVCLCAESHKNLRDSYRHGLYFDLEGNELPISDTPASQILSGKSVTAQVLLVKYPKKEMYISVSGTPLLDDSGNFIMGIISIRDITSTINDQKALERIHQQLLNSEQEKNEALRKAMEMKDEFLSIISHEFRTPINVISMAIQTLNSIYSDQMTDIIKKYLATIKQNTNRQLRLVNNLLDITRANAGRIKINKRNIDIVFLTKVITESVYEFASRKRVRITFESKLTKKIVAIDDEKYERIILNLLSNAIKFTPEGKSIIVSLRLLRGKICIQVRDFGIGIPLNKIDEIFEKFGQVNSSLSRQAEGTGIGLSLVKKFVEALGGSVSVKSTVGEGTLFKILLLDETIVEEQNRESITDLMNDNRLIQTTNIEFSDIYL